MNGESTHQKKTIHLATDHAGFALKEILRDWLLAQGYQVVDHGACQHEPEDDFPDYIKKAATAVAKNPTTTIGIILGGSGQGEAMVANRFKNVRATVYYGGADEIITLSRTHNDANILSLGARFLNEESAKAAITKWLCTPFAGEAKRVRRNQKIEHLET